MSNDLWVFAYGSLIWNPGFEVAEACLARADGFRRGFYMRSVHYRGTHDAPGLVLALDVCEGQSCTGMALRAAPGTGAAVLTYLRARELISYAYYEQTCRLNLHDGRNVKATTFVVARDHAQYAGDLPLEAQAEIIARAKGSAGPNRDYLENTVRSLRGLDIDAPDLFALSQMVSARSA
ncbi:MAG: gamma-glutamylcyclotransferase [Paracoccaceae bacterium]